MQETEFSLIDICFCALRKWRRIIGFAIACAILLGAVVAVVRVVQMNDEDMVEQWETEYEVALGQYWAGINEYDRQINENERLIAQAQDAIDSLGQTELNYRGDIADLEANIDHHQEMANDYQVSIDQLTQKKEMLTYYLDYRKEQNENSLYMQIDPYNVKTYEAYLRVDSGYEIMPGSSYQNIDRTSELLQTYCLLVNTAGFYETMIADLELDTELRYLTEVISVTAPENNIGSLRVAVISNDVDWSKRVGEYIVQKLLSSYDEVAQLVADHTLALYNEMSYSVVDLSLYLKQCEYLDEEISYENSIVEVDTAILAAEAEIRALNTEVRGFETEIGNINRTITGLPLQKQLHENEVSKYKDANYDLMDSKLELMEEPEPSYHGFTPISVLTGFIKFAVIGGVIGAVLAALYVVLVGLFSGKAISSEQLGTVAEAGFFGIWPLDRKVRFAFVDRWIDVRSGLRTKDTTPETARELVLSNLAVACKDAARLLICGGAEQEAVAAVAEALRERKPKLEIVYGGQIGFDPTVVHGLAACDAVLLVEQLDKSGLSAVQQMKLRARTVNKPILGFVLV